MIDLILFALVIYLVYGALAATLTSVIVGSLSKDGTEDTTSMRMGCGIARWLVAAGLAAIAWNWPEWLPL